MRSLIEVTWPSGDGGIGLLWEWTDIALEPWETYLRPLAELVAESHPDAVWTAKPIPDDWTDRRALSGH